jgi:hypothetical protein
MEMSKPTPRQLATIVRKRAEEYAERTEGFDPKTLDSMCAIASYALVKALHKHGYKSAKLVVFEDENEGHCWVEYNGYVYDVTATQFDMRRPGVFIVRTTHDEYNWAKNMKNHPHVKVVKRPGRFLRVGWPDYQCPRRDVIYFFMKVIP